MLVVGGLGSHHRAGGRKLSSPLRLAGANFQAAVSVVSSFIGSLIHEAAGRSKI